MRELDRENNDTPLSRAVAVVGRGRLGCALAQALGAGGAARPRRMPPPRDAEVVILAVPDAAIAPLAAALPPGPAVGHCAGRARPRRARSPTASASRCTR